MLNVGKIECCNIDHSGRIYNIGSNTYLIFVDECYICGQPVAEIRARNSKGEVITKLRRSGTAALRLYEKYGIKQTEYDYSIYSGTQVKEYSFTNIRGQIYNDNGVRIAAHDDFLKMSRTEINAVLNKRFYKATITI